LNILAIRQKYAGRHPQEVLKVAVKMAVVGKANLMGNFGNGQAALTSSSLARSTRQRIRYWWGTALWLV